MECCRGVLFWNSSGISGKWEGSLDNVLSVRSCPRLLRDFYSAAKFLLFMVQHQREQVPGSPRAAQKMTAVITKTRQFTRVSEQMRARLIGLVARRIIVEHYRRVCLVSGDEDDPVQMIWQLDEYARLFLLPVLRGDIFDRDLDRVGVEVVLAVGSLLIPRLLEVLRAFPAASMDDGMDRIHSLEDARAIREVFSLMLNDDPINVCREPLQHYVFRVLMSLEDDAQIWQYAFLTRLLFEDTYGGRIFVALRDMHQPAGEYDTFMKSNLDYLPGFSQAYRELVVAVAETDDDNAPLWQQALLNARKPLFYACCMYIPEYCSVCRTMSVSSMRLQSSSANQKS